MNEDFEYISRARLEYHHGYRHACLGEVPEPVVYGMQGALRQYYGHADGGCEFDPRRPLQTRGGAVPRRTPSRLM